MSDRIEYTKPNGTKILLNDRPEVAEYAESLGYKRTGATPADAPEPEPEKTPEPVAAAPEPESAPEPEQEEVPAAPQRRQRTVRPVAG